MIAGGREHDRILLGYHHLAAIARRQVFHAGADDRRVWSQQRHRLALHVRSHQRAVGVVVLQERHQRGGHRDQLLRRHVDELDLRAWRQDEVAGAAGVDAVLDEAAVLLERRIRLGDDVVVLFPRRQVVGVGLELDALLLRPAVGADELVGFHHVPRLVLGVAAGVQDLDVVDDASVLDLSVRRLDEAELIDARVARER